MSGHPAPGRADVRPTGPAGPRRALPDSPWARPADGVLEHLGVRAEDGLTGEQAARRLARHGRNALRQRPGPTLLGLVLAQLRDTMVVVLLCAAALTVAVRDLKDTAVILLVIIVNTTLGVGQQLRAEGAVAALSRLTAPVGTVLRDGRVGPVQAEEVVPGDVLVLQEGDVVVADARLVTVSDLHAGEATLTGESAPVRKALAPCPGEGTPVADRTCMVHAGTAVTSGRGRAVVTATGVDTQVGRLAQLLDAQPAPATPLQRRLAVLGGQLAAVAVAGCSVVLAVGLAGGQPVEQVLLTAVSLAVAAVPESLPAVVALSLAVSARRMSTRGAVVRTLPAVESLGSVTLIASDKTGTLTEGVMTARHVWSPAAELDLPGSGYDPAPLGLPAVPALADLLRALVLCNDAHLVPPSADGAWGCAGDPMEGALLAAAGRTGLDVEQVRAAAPRVGEVPFSAARSRMTTLHATPGGDVLVVVKGAPEVVLGPGGPLRAGQSDAARVAAARAAGLAAQGWRVLAVAAGRRPDVPREVVRAERDLDLLGLVALQDPPRPEARASVARCRDAGIVPVMVTGDHPGTAAAVAEAIGLLRAGDRVVTGAELPALLDDGGPAGVRVFARTAPEQKLELVERWRRDGEVVAMTGDGVNDAPALRRADVGVAMGRGGTEVARQAADVVLTDDRFSTVITAVQEGRRVYDNVRRFLLYALAGGAAELLVMLVGPAVGLALPLLPAQILWVNLLTHGLPGVALGAEQAEPGVMRRPPRPPGQGVLGGGLWQRTLALGVLVAAVPLALALLVRAQDGPWQSVLFVALATQQLLLALSLRSLARPAWHLAGNPLLYAAVGLNAGLLLAALYWSPLAGLLGTEPLRAGALALALGGSLLAPVVVETAKALHRSSGVP